MLAPNPSDRFSSVTEVLHALKNTSVLAFKGELAIQNLPAKQVLSRLINRISLFATVSALLLMGGFWWSQRKEMANILPVISNSQNLAEKESRLQKQFSTGERVLISQTTTPEKELAAAFARVYYSDSSSLLLKSLKTQANDPEALIDINNAQIGQQKAYSIAFSVPIGTNVNSSEEILRGVTLAETSIDRQGGIKGIPLKVQIINDDNQAKIGQQVAMILSQNSEILGVVGHYASDVTLATAEIYQSGQLVVISPISTSVKLSNLSPYLFRTFSNICLKNSTKKDVAVFYNSQSNYRVVLQRLERRLIAHIHQPHRCSIHEIVVKPQ